MSAPANSSDRSAMTLVERMRVMAATGHENAADLTKRADELEAAGKGFYAKEQTHTGKQLIGAWARARIAWCQASGEPML